MSQSGRDDASREVAVAEELQQKLDLVLEEMRWLPGRERHEQERKGGCTGKACKGEGMASHFVPANACPNPCDNREYLPRTEELAKQRAYHDAQVNCGAESLSDNCECKDGVYRLIKKTCVPVVVGGVKYCAYDIYYSYQGTCLPR